MSTFAIHSTVIAQIDKFRNCVYGGGLTLMQDRNQKLPEQMFVSQRRKGDWE